LGSVKNITDSTETIVESYEYDSFGNLIVAPTTGNPYTYTSREYDAETSLYFYRARYYDSTIGRFLTEDPIWDVNLYFYVGNDPINFIDPSGNFQMGSPIPWTIPNLPTGPIGPINPTLPTIELPTTPPQNPLPSIPPPINSPRGNPRPGGPCRFVRVIDNGGCQVTCVYICPGYGGPVTYPQERGQPCYGIDDNGWVDYP